MITFSHAGSIQELLYSFYFIRDYLNLTKQKKCNLNLQMSNDFPLSYIMYIKPLLETIPFINQIYMESYLQNDWIDITMYRDVNYKTLQNNNITDIRQHPYILANTICSRQFWTPICKFKQKYKSELNTKILFCGSNVGLHYDFSFMRDISNRIVYLGNNDDYNTLQSKFNLHLTRIESNNALETAKILNSVALIISNQNTTYAIAEIYKFPRILYSKDLVFKNNGYHINDQQNILPLGGTCMTAKGEQMLFKKMLLFLKDLN